MRAVKTASGAEYEFFGGRVRRLEAASENSKRKDGEWLVLHNAEEFVVDRSLVGMSLFLQLEQLSAEGPDDEGRPQGSVVGGSTTRMTTPVVYDSWFVEDSDV